MFGVATQYGCEAVFGVRYGLSNKEVIQESHSDFVNKEAKIMIFLFVGKSSEQKEEKTHILSCEYGSFQ